MPEEGYVWSIKYIRSSGTQKEVLMQDRLFIRDHLAQFFDEVDPMEFYRSIFPEGELEEAGRQDAGVTGKYNALAVELLPVSEKAENKRANARKYIITDDLEGIRTLLHSENFIIISPISYIGKSRQSQNARYIYAMAIDLDGVTKQRNLDDLLHQIEIEYLPRPTYLVWSGTGLHLYYQFIQPLPCFKNIATQLAGMKKELTKKIWNGYVSDLAEKPQIESLFQGFRMVGGVTKGGNRVKAFSFGDKVSIEYLNEFVPKEAKVERFTYKSNLTLQEAAKKYPEWYDKRIRQKQKKGTWKAKKAVYDWWLRELKEKIVVGHRYYGVMVLAVYAAKCGVDRETLEADAFGLVSMLERLTVEERNHFTREDVLAAIEMYNDNYITFPIDSIVKLTAVPIEKNKRNFRKQEVHLRIARGTKAILKEAGELKADGRPSKATEVRDWRLLNPEGTIKDCMEALGISKSTAYKYWKESIGS